MARQSERRSHLDLQVGMLSEQELTTILQMLQKLCQHVGVNVDASKQEVQSFSETTDVHKLAANSRTNFRRSSGRYLHQRALLRIRCPMSLEPEDGTW